jgi:septum formation protein
MLGYSYTQEFPEYEEVPPTHQSLPLEELPLYYAEQKSLLLSQKLIELPILSFDTMVLFQDAILGKPQTAEEAIETLTKMSGQKHTVITGVSLSLNGQRITSEKEHTSVQFCSASSKEIENYVATQDPMDKAGSYGIQGPGAFLVEGIQGCFYNVMGVPIQRTRKILNSLS